MRNSLFAQVVGTAKYTVAPTVDHTGYTWNTTNELLAGQFYAGATGVKTGFTGNAGDCLVFSASRSDGDLLGVELGEPSSDARFSDATALLDWGFAIEHSLILGSANGPR
jgi:D-alanyl-D-alanine carboxypeptidase (penicillin-binding protein 5/6)